MLRPQPFGTGAAAGTVQGTGFGLSGGTIGFATTTPSTSPVLGPMGQNLSVRNAFRAHFTLTVSADTTVRFQAASSGNAQVRLFADADLVVRSVVPA